VKQISSALVKAQRDFEPARKESTNPAFRSKYANLEACIDAVLSALNANGIMLCQPCHECSDGVIIETLFIHESGETFSAGKLHVPAAKQDPQGYGSALTYARRYSLLAACGIAPEDDDGNAASSSVQQPKQSPQKPPQKAQTPSPKDPAHEKAAAEYKRLLAEISNAPTLAEMNIVYATIESAEIPETGKTALIETYNKRVAKFAEEAFK